MKKAGLIILMGILVSLVQAQKDPEAKKILDRISSRSLSDAPVKVDFEYIYEDLMNKETTTEKGNLIIDGDKFRLDIGSSIVCSDGVTTWNYLTEANEVYISDAEDTEGGFFINNPSDLFTFYQEGFKYRLKGEIEAMGKTLYEIDIYPEDLDNNYHTVKLLVGKKDERIVSAEAFGKGGANHTIILNGYKRKADTDESTFVFDPDEHPGVEIVDTRL